jgi:hypothetical protein
MEAVRLKRMKNKTLFNRVTCREPLAAKETDEAEVNTGHQDARGAMQEIVHWFGMGVECMTPRLYEQMP